MVLVVPVGRLCDCFQVFSVLSFCLVRSADVSLLLLFAVRCYHYEHVVLNDAEMSSRIDSIVLHRILGPFLPLRNYQNNCIARFLAAATAFLFLTGTLAARAELKE